MSKHLINCFNKCNYDIDYDIEHVIDIYSLLPWLYCLIKVYPDKPLIIKKDLAVCLSIFNASIYYPESDNIINNSTKAWYSSLFYYALLPLFTNEFGKNNNKEENADNNNNNSNNDKRSEYLEVLSSYLYLLCYQMKPTLALNDPNDSKLNLYFLILALYDSYGITYNGLEGRFLFENNEINDLKFYNANMSFEILTLLNTVEYSPMIVLLWIKKISYNIFDWIEDITEIEVIVYDINEVLTTNQQQTSRIKEKITSYFSILTYFIDNFAQIDKGNSSIEAKQRQFYHMNVYCLFLSFLEINEKVKELQQQKQKSYDEINIKQIDAFITQYRKDNKQINFISNDELLNEPKYIMSNNKEKEDLIMRNTKDLFNDSKENSVVYQYKQYRCKSSIWKEPFEIRNSDRTKFLFSKYQNEAIYSEVLVYMMSNYNIDQEDSIKKTKPSVYNDECLFRRKEETTQGIEIEDEEENNDNKLNNDVMEFQYVNNNNKINDLIGIGNEIEEKEKKFILSENKNKKSRIPKKPIGGFNEFVEGNI